MKISELAEIADVSVRTIRHYHQIGLMPVPARTGAWRNYTFEDVALLIHIRNMASAGIPLSEIKHQLDSAKLLSFEDVLASIDSQIAKLKQQRKKLLKLQDRRSATSVHPPDPIAGYYDEIEAALIARGAHKSLAMVRQKRKLSEVLFQLGLFRDEFNDSTRRVSADRLADFCIKLEKLFGSEWTMADCEELTDETLKLRDEIMPFDDRMRKLTSTLVHSPIVEKLTRAAYPEPGMQTYISLCFSRLRDIDNIT